MNGEDLYVRQKKYMVERIRDWLDIKKEKLQENKLRDGIDAEKLAWVRELKEVRRGRISEYADEFGVKYYAGKRPWSVPCDLAFPCATQNEVNGEEAADTGHRYGRDGHPA